MSNTGFSAGPGESFAPLYREIAESVVREPPPAGRPTMRERLVRCLWFDQDFEDVLRTEGGEKLTVLSPGWWNLEAGPDFRHAAIKFAGGKPVKGDVEVHTYASGWTEHGHQNDEGYDNVILHVVMWNDTAAETTARHDGREVPILALHEHVRDTVDELTETLNAEEYPHASEGSAGRCQDLLARSAIDPEWVGQFLNHAGDERMLRKAARFAEMPEAADPENMLYVSLMEAAGFKKNKRPMGRLARLVPLDAAARLLGKGGVSLLQSALLGMAGLLPRQLELAGAERDAETAAYVRQLRDGWETMQESLDGGPMAPSAWKLSGTRPANYPARRIAGMSRLIERAAESGGLVPAVERELSRAPAAPSRRIARSPAAKALIEFLSGVTDEYWTWHTTIGGKKLRSATRLIGRDRATIMFVDAIVPIMLATARARGDADLEKRLHRAYATLPVLAPNSVLRFMASRIFGGDAPAGEVVKSARQQQGLFQLFRDYCEAESDGCRRCAFAKALETR